MPDFHKIGMALDAAEAFFKGLGGTDGNSSGSRHGRNAAVPKNLEERVRNLERVAVSHERDIHELQDRISFAFSQRRSY